ncbi:DSD1 family PLP-dependent enzyme [Alteromonas aestuariivivens]|uniref:DSD1 family PLP-dependent enzyme n=2 Tax=Alteromonas aestuariivivens TaxID=1938339 RepID=A0A3D8M4K7_9ALTE|nr:DSD1 family PLP-dependent enzyme [Alteromonas aestuariivivens]
MTPACVIDRAKLRVNAERLKTLCSQRGIQLRPHVKTLKSVQAAQLYAPPGSAITVSTLAEARYFAAAGYRDILYAVGVTPNKLPAINNLLGAGVALTVIVDSEAGAEHLIAFAQQFSSPLRVAIEIDVDDHRAGIRAQDPELIAVARKIDLQPGLQFYGVMAHAGASYGCFDISSRSAMAVQEARQTAEAARLLGEQGIPCELVSVGSTPTALVDIERPGITELRAGVYATFDCVMAGLGVCNYNDIAMSVLTSVIGHQVDKGWVLIDAGWMALSRDQGTGSHALDCGYGLVCDAKGRLLEGWYVAQTNQEHGIIAHRDGISPPSELFKYGTTLRILPVHACATGAQFEQYHVTDDNDCVSTVWPRVNGW